MHTSTLILRPWITAVGLGTRLAHFQWFFCLVNYGYSFLTYARVGCELAHMLTDSLENSHTCAFIYTDTLLLHHFLHIEKMPILTGPCQIANMRLINFTRHCADMQVLFGVKMLHQTHQITVEVKPCLHQITIEVDICLRQTYNTVKVGIRPTEVLSRPGFGSSKSLSRSGFGFTESLSTSESDSVKALPRSCSGLEMWRRPCMKESSWWPVPTDTSSVDLHQ